MLCRIHLGAERRHVVDRILLGHFPLAAPVLVQESGRYPDDMIFAGSKAR